MRVGMRFAAVVAVLVVALLLIAGCQRGGPAALATDLEGTWVLESFGGANEVKPAAKGVTTGMVLKAGQASGTGGVNQFSTTYNTPKAGALLFSPVASTQVGGEEDAQTQETAFFMALGMTESYEIDGTGRLVLSDKEGNTILVLRPK